MMALLDRVFLAADFSHSAHWIYHVSPFWFATFLQRDLLLTLWGLPCKLGTSFVLLFLGFFFFITIFCKFNYNTSGVGLFLSILMGVLYASWIWIFVCFPKLGKFSAIISSNKPSAPFSLSSSGTLLQTLLHLMKLLSSLSLLSWFIDLL